MSILSLLADVKMAANVADVLGSTLEEYGDDSALRASHMLEHVLSSRRLAKTQLSTPITDCTGEWDCLSRHHRSVVQLLEAMTKVVASLRRNQVSAPSNQR